MKLELTNILVRNYKSIKDLDLVIKPLNILIGANGAGKSNFLSIFSLLQNLMNKNLQNFVNKNGGADNMLFYGIKDSSSIFFKIAFGNNIYKVDLSSTTRNSLFFQKEVVSFSINNTENEQDNLGSGHIETNLYDVVNNKSYKNYKKLSGQIADFLEEINVYHLNDTGVESKLRMQSNIDDNKILRTNGSNLASFIYSIFEKNRKYFDLLESTVRLFFPQFQRFILKPEGRFVKLVWKESSSDKYFDAYDFSDGTIRMIFYSALLLQPQPPKIIILDEPELGLHPYSMSLLISLLKRASKKSTVLMATQSSEFINYFEPSDIIVVDRNSRFNIDNNEAHVQSIFKRLEKKSLSVWLKNYSIAEVWEKNIIGGRPK